MGLSHAGGFLLCPSHPSFLTPSGLKLKHGGCEVCHSQAPYHPSLWSLPAPYQPAVAQFLSRNQAAATACLWRRDGPGIMVGHSILWHEASSVCQAWWWSQSTLDQGVSMAGSHTSWGGEGTGHASTHPLVPLLSQHGSGGCGGEPRGAPTTPRTGRDRAGLVAVLATGRLCHDGAQQPSETLTVLSPLAVPSRGHGEDVSHLPGTAGHDPAAVTPGKAPGSRRCSWDGLEPRATLLGPCVCAREGSGSPPALGTQHQQPHLISRENEAQGYRVVPGSLWAHPPPCQQSGGQGPHQPPAGTPDPSS